MKSRMILIVAVLATMAGCNSPSTGSSSNSTPAPADASVYYQVSGTACAVDLTYQNASGGTSQTTNTPVPWRLDFTVPAAKKSGWFLYVSAQISLPCPAGTVTATIVANGTTVQTSTSSGLYVIATASGSL